jgi:(p)ppGpp synthase/HD superfamily hydrolase
LDMLSERFESAMVWAARQHARQRRHNTGTPYLSHLLATCAIVIEEGGDESLAIAALLHDVLEDTTTTRAELHDRFGTAIYQTVDDCTDADHRERAGMSWRERKQSHLRRMTAFSAGSLLVIAADKVCSLQSLVDDLERFGLALFENSVRSAEELLEGYQEVYAILAARLGSRPVVRRLALLIEQLATVTRSGRTTGLRWRLSRSVRAAWWTPRR